MRRVAVYAGTRAAYRNMEIAAKSLVQHTAMDRVIFLIEDDVFPAELPELISCVNVSGQQWFDPDGPNYASQWTYMSMMRLALPDMLAENRVLWLDTDTIVRKDIGALFDIDLCGCYTAMVEEPVRSRDPFEYFNAGVMLMDLNKLRIDKIPEKWIRMINRKAFTAPDQDVINIICQGEILKLPPEWNDAEHITQKTKDPYIKHYAGSLKWTEPEIFRVYENQEWTVKTHDPENDSAENQ